MNGCSSSKYGQSNRFSKKRITFSLNSFALEIEFELREFELQKLSFIYYFFCPPYKSWTCIKVFISNKNLSLPFFVILSAHLDLPTQSTLLYNATKILIRWEQLLVASLDSYTVEETLINAYPPSSTGEGGGVMRGGLTLQKTKLLLDPDNTPFRFVIISLIIAVFLSQSKKPTLTLLQ